MRSFSYIQIKLRMEDTVTRRANKAEHNEQADGSTQSTRRQQKARGKQRRTWSSWSEAGIEPSLKNTQIPRLLPTYISKI